jgi:hypothetical protein
LAYDRPSSWYFSSLSLVLRGEREGLIPSFSLHSTFRQTMFTADLSWSGPNTETVGERRERKVRERSSTAGSIRTSTSSRSSVVVDRELWWASGLKKAKGIKSNILRPSSHHSTKSQTTIRSGPKKLELQLPHNLKDPSLQPAWTYANTLSPTLPSGAAFDLQTQEVPELDGDSSSRRTNSTEARFSCKCNIIIESEWTS